MTSKFSEKVYAFEDAGILIIPQFRFVHNVGDKSSYKTPLPRY